MLRVLQALRKTQCRKPKMKCPEILDGNQVYCSIYLIDRAIHKIERRNRPVPEGKHMALMISRV